MRMQSADKALKFLYEASNAFYQASNAVYLRKALKSQDIARAR